MALEEREYVNQRYRLSEQHKEARMDDLRRRFEEATPKHTKRFKFPFPTSTAAIAIGAILFGCATAAIVIGIVKLTN